MIKYRILVFCLLGFLLPHLHANLLPPELAWQGKSLDLIKANSTWATPIESNNFTETPNAEQSYEWLATLAEKSPHYSLQPIGNSLENRRIQLFIASKSKHEPKAISSNGKPTLLFHGGIHAGEIDGKDAGMMFFRDIMLDDFTLLDNINILFIPIVNVDGHERTGFNHRVNQRGPNNMGWRTNSQNLNLNRDFAKLETAGVSSLIQLFNNWRVDLYVDVHVTDGIDYQYDITYGFNTTNAYSDNISQWLEQTLRPAVDKQLSSLGHTPGPLIFAVNNKDLHQGIVEWTAGIRFSNGYADARHLPAILVENHSLKPYKQRVVGTLVFLNAVTELLSKEFKTLRSAINQDKNTRKENLALSFLFDKMPLRQQNFAGVKFTHYDSPISGSKEVRWLGEKQPYQVPVLGSKVRHQIKPPKAYWIPSSYPNIIKKLQQHGIKLTILDKDTDFDGELYRIENFEFNPEPFEGQMMVTVSEVSVIKTKKTFRAGSAIVDTNQSLGTLATLLLEPLASDSFLQWGYFNSIFQRTEYIEGYVIEPLAQTMLSNDPKLKTAFEQALADDKELKSNPRKRLQWFYERSDFYDQAHRLYPIGRSF